MLRVGGDRNLTHVDVVTGDDMLFPGRIVFGAGGDGISRVQSTPHYRRHVSDIAAQGNSRAFLRRDAAGENRPVGNFRRLEQNGVTTLTGDGGGDMRQLVREADRLSDARQPARTLQMLHKTT